MDERRYFLQLDGVVNGPYRAEQVRELVVGQVVNARTPAAIAADGPWMTIADVPELALLVPAWTTAAIKPGDVQMLNERGTKGVDLRELIAAAQVKGPVLGGGRHSAPGSAPAVRAEPLNDVQELVRSVQATEAKFAAPLPLPQKRPVSRSAKTIAVLWGVMLLLAVGFRLVYAGRWTPLSTNILLGWLVLGHVFLAALYLVFRKTESDAG